VTVRPAGRADYAALVELRRRSRLETDGVGLGAEPEFDERFTAWLDVQLARGSLAWVAEDAGSMVGMLLMFVLERMPAPERPPSRWGYVVNAFVLPEHRDRGVGTQLVAAATEHADAQGYARLVLTASGRAVPLYARAGFSRDHPLLVREPTPRDHVGR